MGSDSAFGEPYYGDALRQDNEQKRRALAVACAEAEEALASYEQPLPAPTCSLCGKELDCHYSGPDGTRWYCGNYFAGKEARAHFDASAVYRPQPARAPRLAVALRSLLAALPAEGEAPAPQPAATAEVTRRHPGHGRIGELESLLRECNAVCLCGCPDSEHEADECGEGCGHDDHECLRVAPAVLAYVQDLRQRWADLGEDYEGLRALINPPHPSWDTSCIRCGRDLTVSSATCGECCAETPAAGVVEVTPAPPSPEVEAAAEKVRRLRWESGLGGNDVLMAATDALLDTIDAARSAAPDEALTAWCDVCEVDRGQPCHSTTTGEVALYPHPERLAAARGAKGGGE